MAESTIKTTVDTDAVLAYVRRVMSRSVAGLTPLEGGETSTAFAFASDSRDYVIRVNGSDYAFRKDAYAAATLGRDLTHYDSRLRCYASCIGLSALVFFAMSAQNGKYSWLKQRLVDIAVLD